MRPFTFFNPRGDLFATTVCFAAQGLIKFGSSLVLTRLLRPEAYGIITILMSIAFVLEMLADINVTIFIVRDHNGDDPRYINTAWTLRLGRALLNCSILLIAAPAIASLYNIPMLTVPLRIFSIWFLLGGLESMSFPLAVRHKRSRIWLYSELAASFVSTAFAVAYTSFSRDFWGMLYAILLGRALVTLFSYRFYRDLRPSLGWDRDAAGGMMRLTRYTMPSSMLTLALSQFDKVAFLKLFDLQLLGIYGLAANMSGLVESLVSKISQTVLYPRCAHNFRTDRGSFVLRYYKENAKLFGTILFIPAAAGGAAHLIIGLLYPERYGTAGTVLQALMLRTVLLALASPAEDFLIAAGESQVILLGNVFRAAWMLSVSLTAYYCFGFIGFIYGIASSGLPPLLYYLWLQRKKGMLDVRYEIYKYVFAFTIGGSSYLMCRIFAALWLPTKTAF